MSGALGYVYQILIGRLLGPEDFSTVATVTSIYLICASPLTAITLIFARQASKNIAIGRESLVPHTFYIWVRKAIRIAVFSATISILFLLLADYLLKARFLFFGCTIIVLVATAAFFHLTTGYFQGCLQFRTMASLGLFQVFMKLFLSKLM